MYRDLLGAYPGYVDAWCNLAAAYRALDDFGNAHAGFDQALKLQPGLEKAKAGLAETSPAWSSALEGCRLIMRRQDDSDAEFLASCYGNVAFLDRYNRYLPRFRHSDVLRGSSRLSGPGILSKWGGRLGRAEKIQCKAGRCGQFG